MQFNDKTVLITGASSGIGKQLALDFNRLGATVCLILVLVYLFPKLFFEVSEALFYHNSNIFLGCHVRKECWWTSKDKGWRYLSYSRIWLLFIYKILQINLELKNPDKAHVYFMDLEKIEDLKNLALEIDSKHKIDILINNGGTSMREEFANLELPMVTRMMKVNFLSCVTLARYIGEGMSKRGGGQIANVISVAGLFPVPVRTIYSASKYATSVFSSSMRAEFKDLNISVTDIYPGYVQTNISKNALVGDGSSFGKQDENIGKGMKVDEACRIILNGIYLKCHRVVIWEFKVKLAIFLSNLSSDLMALFSKVNYCLSYTID